MAFSKRNSGEGRPKAATNGPTGKSQLHSINAGQSGHPVKGKGTSLKGKAY